MFVQTYWMTQSLDSHTDYELESFKEAISDLKRIRKLFLFLSLIDKT
jgi:hypothetical protein